MPKRGGRRKKKKNHKEVAPSERELKLTPRCFVVKSGNIGKRLQDLVKDLRLLMMPNCAKDLKESRKNKIADFIAVAGPLHVSHLIIVSATKVASYMKLVKLPQGPTVTFRIEKFSLMHDVRAVQRRPHSGNRDFTVAPLQVLSGFGGCQGEQRLTHEMLKGMFPPVDVPKFNQADCRRTALFHLDKQADHILVRHYSVLRRNMSMHEGVARLLQSTRRIPKLGQRQDIADFVLGTTGRDSGDEAEGAVEASHSSGKRGVRLVECGPRLTLLLVKAEEGVCGGGVLFHRFQKTKPSQRKVREAQAKQKQQLRERSLRLVAKAQKMLAKRKAKKKAKTRDADEEGLSDGDEPKEPRASKGEGKGKVKGKGKGKGKGSAKLGAEKESQGMNKFHPFAFGAAKAAKKGKKKSAGSKKKSAGTKGKRRK